MDPRGHVRPGERLRIAASQINALNAMMRPDVGFQAESLTGYGPLNTIILARNSTGGDIARWGVMKIAGIEIDPNDGDTERRSFEEMPCVIGVAADAGEEHAAVAIEPIKAGKIGRISVAGVVQIPSADVFKVASALELWNDGSWALIRFGVGGVRLGTISATWTKGTTATVTQVKGDGAAITPEVTFAAKNWFATVTVTGSGTTKKVACAKVDATWILIAAEC